VIAERRCLGCGRRDHLVKCAECLNYFCTLELASSWWGPAELSCYRQHELTEEEEATS